eukprot:scaffold68817_cov43-Attheya_sp.AAC.1
MKGPTRDQSKLLFALLAKPISVQTARAKVGWKRNDPMKGSPYCPPPGEDDAPHPKKKTRTRNKSSSKKEKLSITLTRLKCQMAVQVKELKAATDNIAALNAEKHRLGKKVGYWKNETKKKQGVD